VKNLEKRAEFLVFGKPDIQDQEIDEVIACLKTGWIGTGPRVDAFESQFRKYKQAGNAVAMNSCTAGLHLSLLALGIGPGDEVITSPLTFCATVNSIIHVGATPVLADVCPLSMNIDPLEIESKITKQTKCVLPVHFAGRPCSMDSILEIVSENQLFLVEDCAHAIETEYHGKPAGTFGEFGCFSFYATKNVATGEGGMVISDDDEKADRIQRLALHGLSKNAWKRFGDDGYQHYFVEELGFKYNMMDLQAALGIHQLKRVEKNWKRREQLWHHYNDMLASLPIILPLPPEDDTRHAYHLYTILIDEKNTGLSRDNVVTKMHQEGVGTGIHYLSIPEHPYYQRTFGWKPDDFPNAMSIGRQTMSLPLSPSLSDVDVDWVIDAAQKTLSC
jgi:dTDP-4-amino-4,6-dideoxygalactose transaminase